MFSYFFCISFLTKYILFLQLYLKILHHIIYNAINCSINVVLVFACSVIKQNGIVQSGRKCAIKVTVELQPLLKIFGYNVNHMLSDKLQWRKCTLARANDHDHHHHHQCQIIPEPLNVFLGMPTPMDEVLQALL